MDALRTLIEQYWPYIVFAISVIGGTVAAVHAAMTKHDVRAAIGWVGISIFSPLFGALFYLIAGINRVRSTRKGLMREEVMLQHAYVQQVPVDELVARCGPQFASLRTLGNRVSRFNIAGGNAVRPLDGGSETYRAMLEAIRRSTHSIALQTYIFDNDSVGREIADALIEARERGVQVRVLIDAVGVRYSMPTIVTRLNRGKVPTALFNPNPLFFWRMPYANLRCHRKVLVIDGQVGFTGGMNIRRAFVDQGDGIAPAQDTHFYVAGPVVHQLLSVFAHDWDLTTGESLKGAQWFKSPQAEIQQNQLNQPNLDRQEPSANETLAQEPTLQPAGDVPMRCIPAGPDRYIGSTHKMLLGALAVAQRRVRIQSPYFLPDVTLIGALATAARRGVVVDIVIPGTNNLKLVDYAMTAQLDQVIRTGCRVWRATGPFDHSKIMVVDDAWSYIGSSNLDPRSLRLNFELDSEIYDTEVAQWLGARVDRLMLSGNRVTLGTLYKLAFFKRLRNKLIWLASPYL
ncbi:MAG: PLDc N-terminal domain-containing protein [Burkholderiaceae bacterium]|nr:PLDc N-terminal domain-containing protein [Burkholderiaceae bacterium]